MLCEHSHQVNISWHHSFWKEDFSYFRVICLTVKFGFLFPVIFNYLSFYSFGFEPTWWRLHTKLDIIMFLLSQFRYLSSYYQVCNRKNTTETYYGAGTAYSSAATEFTPCNLVALVLLSIWLYVHSFVDHYLSFYPFSICTYPSWAVQLHWLNKVRSKISLSEI